MSRKHPPLPVSDVQRTLFAVARRRDEMMAEGHRLGSLIVVLDPILWGEMSRLWANSVVKEMLGMRAELDPKADGWAVKVKGQG